MYYEKIQTAHLTCYEKFTWHTYCFMQNLNITLNMSTKILSVTLDILRKISQTKRYHYGENFSLQVPEEKECHISAVMHEVSQAAQTN